MNNNEKLNSLSQEEEFPFPKLVRLFDFFFPKEKGSKDIFTMANLRKFGPRAPILGLVIMIGLAAWILCDAVKAESIGSHSRLFSGIVTMIFLVMAIVKYLWWLAIAVLSKIARRSPVTCLAMTAVGPLEALAISCIAHGIGFICRLIATLG